MALDLKHHGMELGIDFGQEEPIVFITTPVADLRHRQLLEEQRKTLDDMWSAFRIPAEWLEPQRKDRTMSIVHVDKEGTAKFIAAMEDGEVLNAIKEFATPLVEINSRIDVDLEPRSKLSKLSYGEPDKINPEKYQEMLRMTQVKIAPYVIEAALRGLEELPMVLQKIFGGRKAMDASAPKPGHDSMTQNQVDLVRSVARGKQGEGVLELGVWTEQDGIGVPTLEDVIIDAG